MKRSKIIVCAVLAVLACQAAWSADFGLIWDMGAGLDGTGFGGTAPALEYTGMIIPRFSVPVGDDGDFYISAGFKAGYTGSWEFVPELLRTEFSWQFEKGLLKAGRIYYSDPLGFAAAGLFDGVQYSFDTDAGIFSAGAWYTGFLYRKRAGIAMTADEQISLNAELKYSDFLNTYFASKRVMAAFDWFYPGPVSVNLALLGQLDLNDPANLSDGVHTQYLSGKVTIPFGSVILGIGACGEIAELSGSFNFALAGELEAVIDLPTPIEDQLTVLGRYSSGKWEDSSLIAFLPVSGQTQGELLKSKFSGISLISVDYLARLTGSMSIEASSAYFIRNDLNTLHLYGTDGYFLGNEFFARFFWSPFSDLQLNAGAGIFLPSLGNAAPKGEPLWRAELNLVLSIY